MRRSALLSILAGVLLFYDAAFGVIEQFHIRLVTKTS
jgi:hypothetical protein